MRIYRYKAKENALLSIQFTRNHDAVDLVVTRNLYKHTTFDRFNARIHGKHLAELEIVDDIHSFLGEFCQSYLDNRPQITQLSQEDSPKCSCGKPQNVTWLNNPIDTSNCPIHKCTCEKGADLDHWSKCMVHRPNADKRRP